MWLRLLLTRHIFLEWTWKEENHCIGTLLGDYFYYCCGSLWKSMISGVIIIEQTFLDSTWKEEQRVASCHWQPFVDSSISIGWYFLIELEKRNRVATICWWRKVASHCGLWSDFASQQYKYTLLHCSQIHYVTVHKYTINYVVNTSTNRISNRMIHRPAK